MKSKRDPETPAEWQEAADMAWFCLALDSARQYGLVEGGPEIDFERCEEILVRAKEQGISPRDIELIADDIHGRTRNTAAEHPPDGRKSLDTAGR